MKLNLGCGNRVHPEWVNVDYDPIGALRKSLLVKPLIMAGIVAPALEGVFYYDLRKGIPFEAETAEVVYLSHLLEHLDRRVVPCFLKDIYRVLKPNGWVRIVVPDLERIVRDYLSALENCRAGVSGAERRYDWAMLELFDQMVRTQPGGEMAIWQNSIPQDELQPKDHIGKIKRSIRQWMGLNNPATTGELHRWMYDEFSLSRLLRATGFRNITRCSHTQSHIPCWESYGLDSQSDGSPYKPGSLYMEAVK